MTIISNTHPPKTWEERLLNVIKFGVISLLIAIPATGIIAGVTIGIVLNS